MIDHLGKKLRNYFIAGTIALIPVTLTFIILNFLFQKFDNLLMPAVIRILIMFGVPLAPGARVPGIGLLATILTVFIVGVMTKNYFGRKFMQAGEWTLKRIPLVNSIYFASKQLVGAFSVPGKKTFQEVVMVEYPRRGVYTIGFITTNHPHSFHEEHEPLYPVFFPTTPNPTSGILVLVPKDDIFHLPISVEEGIKFVVSGGILTPKIFSIENGEEHRDYRTP